VVSYIRGDLAKPVLPDEDVKGMVLIRGESFRLTMTTNGRENSRLVGKAYFDSSEGTIDLVETEGPDKGGMTAGIFEVNGDEMRICFPVREPFLERPTVMAAEPGSNRELLILRRLGQ
jgi:uncharacterized protein (TIGR03067 family)